MPFWPAINKKEQVFLTHEELSRLLDACSDSPIGDFVTLIGLTGMRKSEARGLRWRDIDISTGDIHIRKAMRYVNHVGMVDGETKNDWSVRKIELNPESNVFNMLASRRAVRSAELLMAGAKVQDTDLVFCYGDGKPWGDRYIFNHFKEILEQAGITKDIGLKSLRHTYATLNLQHDELQNVSRTLGHSSIRTTHDIYGHVIPGSNRKASKRFTEAIKQYSA
jgi:integrase